MFSIDKDNPFGHRITHLSASFDKHLSLADLGGEEIGTRLFIGDPKLNTKNDPFHDVWGDSLERGEWERPIIFKSKKPMGGTSFALIGIIQMKKSWVKDCCGKVKWLAVSFVVTFSVSSILALMEHNAGIHPVQNNLRNLFRAIVSDFSPVSFMFDRDAERNLEFTKTFFIGSNPKRALIEVKKSIAKMVVTTIEDCAGESV